MKTEHTQFLQ